MRRRSYTAGPGAAAASDDAPLAAIRDRLDRDADADAPRRR